MAPFSARNLSVISIYRCYGTLSNALLSEAVDIARDDRDTTLLFRGLGNLIVSMALVGTYATASELAREAIEILDDGCVRDGFEVLGVLLAVGVLHTCRGDWHAARDILSRAVVMADDVEYVGPASVLKALLANALLEIAEQNGDPVLLNRARREIAEGTALAATSEEGMAQSLLHGLEARLSLHSGDTQESERLAVLATSVAWKNRNTTIVFWTLPHLANVYVAVNRTRDARLLSNLMTSHPASPQWVKEHGASVKEALGHPAADGDTGRSHGDQQLEVALRHIVNAAPQRIGRGEGSS